MKRTTVTLIALILSSASCAQEKPTQVPLTPTPVITSDQQNKKVCITDTNTGKETCRFVKIHKKLEGTPVPKK